MQGRVFAVRCRPGIPNPAGDKTVRLLGKSISRNHSHYPTLESYALRCLREWLAASSAPHPNVCRTFEMLFDDRRGRFILVLEYCSGGDLAAWLGGDRPAAQKLRAWKGVAEALNHMHAFGFAHRDIKAHNVLLQDGAAKLADFGSAVCAGRGHPEGVTCGGCPPGGPKWCLGRSGTVSWMAPELFTDEPYDPVLADLFSLGLLLYALFAKRPFSAALPSEHGWKQWSEKGVLPKGDLAALAKVGAVECAKGLMAPLPEDRAEAWRAVRASEWYRGLPC
ncbi:kinase-like domain-containing protein [Hyaloraphidium curvatum]|nr:kinase-like domain-containing protein [Hyaloraphidium curvatum]